MAITFPIPQADLGDVLPIASVEWELERHQEIAMDGSGEFLVADLAPPLWSAAVTLRPQLKTAARALEAQFNALDGSLYSFYLANPMGWYPALDPGGIIYGASTPTIGTIQSNRKELTLTGLPVGYVLSPGDFFAVPYSSGTRRGLFQIVKGATVAGDGTTGNIEVRPHLQAGIVATNAADFSKPAAKVKIVPGSFKKAWYNANRDVISFSVRQTLQAT